MALAVAGTARTPTTIAAASPRLTGRDVSNSVFDARQFPAVSRKAPLRRAATVDRAMEARQLPTQVPDPGHDLDPIHPGSGRGQGLLKRIGGALPALGVFLAQIRSPAQLLLLPLPQRKPFPPSAAA